jgi:hypothetical protein
MKTYETRSKPALVLGSLIALVSVPLFSGRAEAQRMATDLNSVQSTHLPVFYAGPGSNLYEMYYPFAAGDWAQVTGVGSIPARAQNSGIASWVNGIYSETHEFYLTQTSSGLHLEQLWGPTFSPTDLTALTNAEPAASASSIVGFTDTCAQSDNVFYVGANQHLILLTWSPNPGTSAIDLTAKYGAPAVSGTSLTAHEAQASEEIFYVGTNQQVYEMWRWSGCSGEPAFDGWHTTDVSTANGADAPNAIAGSALTSFFDNTGPVSTPQFDAVFYIDANNNVEELYMSNYVPNVSAWNRVNVTSQTGIRAGSASSLANTVTGYCYPCTPGNVENVYFEDQNSELWAVRSSPWASDQVTWLATNASYAAGAPLALSGTPLATDVNYLVCQPEGCESDDVPEELYFVNGSNDHVELMQYTPANGPTFGWTTSDITALTGAPVF